MEAHELLNGFIGLITASLGAYGLYRLRRAKALPDEAKAERHHSETDIAADHAAQKLSQGDITFIRTQYREIILSIKHEYQELQKDVDTLRDAYAKLQADHAKCTGDHAAAVGRMAALEQDIARLKGSIWEAKNSQP